MGNLEDVFEQLEKDIRTAVFYAIKEVDFKENGVNSCFNSNHFQSSFQSYLEIHLGNTSAKIESYLFEKLDEIKGVSKISAIRIRNEILNSFQGNKFKALRALFVIDTDGLTMKRIDQSAFNHAIQNLTVEEKALAKAYFEAINSSETHMVDMTFSYETINNQSINAFQSVNFGSSSNPQYLNQGNQGNVLDPWVGGGVNLGTANNGSFSIIILDSKVGVDFIYKKNGVHYNRFSTPAELLAHELLGHGFGRSINSSTYSHEDAVQMSNLYWKVRGYTNFYRNGTRHGSGMVLLESVARDIPIHFQP